MSFTELPATTHIVVGLEASSKKQLVEKLSTYAEDRTGLARRGFFDAIMRRERLGSTAVGAGIALPHIVHPALNETITIFVLLAAPVSFDAADNKPVDIVCFIAGPEHTDCDHLKAVSGMAKLLRDSEICSRLRSAASAEDVAVALRGEATASAA